ncbi:MAG: hypothetical protein ACOYJY_07190 [Acutalibacteraceae bacterium]|jgi:hypothetical protein
MKKSFWPRYALLAILPAAALLFYSVIWIAREIQSFQTLRVVAEHMEGGFAAKVSFLLTSLRAWPIPVFTLLTATALLTPFAKTRRAASVMRIVAGCIVAACLIWTVVGMIGQPSTTQPPTWLDYWGMRWSARLQTVAVIALAVGCLSPEKWRVVRRVTCVLAATFFLVSPILSVFPLGVDDPILSSLIFWMNSLPPYMVAAAAIIGANWPFRSQRPVSIEETAVDPATD